MPSFLQQGRDISDLSGELLASVERVNVHKNVVLETLFRLVLSGTDDESQTVVITTLLLGALDIKFTGCEDFMTANCRLLTAAPEKQKILDWVEEAKVRKQARLGKSGNGQVFSRGLIEAKKGAAYVPKGPTMKSIQKPLWARIGLNGKPQRTRTQWGNKFWGKNRKKRASGKNELKGTPVPRLRPDWPENRV